MANITNIDLSSTNRSRFTINEDPNRVIWLNLSDMNIAARLSEYYPKLIEVCEDVQKSLADIPDTEEGVAKLGKILTEYDQKMRDIIDKIFDAEVSKACAPDGTMYDLFDGEFRFEKILTALLGLYTDNISGELDKLRKKTDKYTAKYNKKSKK